MYGFIHFQIEIEVAAHAVTLVSFTDPLSVENHDFNCSTERPFIVIQ